MDLPDLVVLKVFSFLEIEETFYRLRLVCQRWKTLVEFNIANQSSLLVYDKRYPRKKRWPSDNRLANPFELIGKAIFQFGLTSFHFQRIKKLYLYHIDWTSLEKAGLMSKIVNCMCQAEALSIDKNGTLKLPGLRLENYNWTFAHLKSLSVKQEFLVKVNITAPNLEKLIVWDQCFGDNKSKGLMLELSHPEKLRYLECQEIDAKLRRFTDLEQVVTQHVKLDFHLSNNPKLKKIDLCFDPRSFRQDRDEYYQELNSLMEQKRSLGLNDLEITNFGIQVEQSPLKGMLKYRERENSRDCFTLREEMMHLISEYSLFKVDYLSWRFLVFYPNSMQGHQHLSKCFSKLNIVLFIVSGELTSPDEGLLIKLLAVELGGLNAVSFRNCSFSQEFYNQLKQVPYLEKLDLYKSPVSNFDFVCQIKCTSKFVFELAEASKLPINSLCENLKKSKIKQFKFGIEPIFNVKLKNNRLGFRQSFSDEAEEEFDNLDDAVAFLRANENYRQYLT